MLNFLLFSEGAMLGRIVPPRQTSTPQFSEPVDFILQDKRYAADVIKVQDLEMGRLF